MRLPLAFALRQSLGHRGARLPSPACDIQFSLTPLTKPANNTHILLQTFFWDTLQFVTVFIVVVCTCLYQFSLHCVCLSPIENSLYQFLIVFLLIVCTCLSQFPCTVFVCHILKIVCTTLSQYSLYQFVLVCTCFPCTVFVCRLLKQFVLNCNSIPCDSLHLFVLVSLHCVCLSPIENSLYQFVIIFSVIVFTCLY